MPQWPLCPRSSCPSPQAILASGESCAPSSWAGRGFAAPPSGSEAVDLGEPAAELQTGHAVCLSSCLRRCASSSPIGLETRARAPSAHGGQTAALTWGHKCLSKYVTPLPQEYSRQIVHETSFSVAAPPQSPHVVKLRCRLHPTPPSHAARQQAGREAGPVPVLTGRWAVCARQVRAASSARSAALLAQTV